MLLMQRTRSCSVARGLTVEMIASLRPSCLHENTAWWFFPPAYLHFWNTIALQKRSSQPSLALLPLFGSVRRRCRPASRTTPKRNHISVKLYRFVDVVKAFSLLGVPVV